MRVFALIVLSIVAGLGLGIGRTWARYGWVSTASDLAATGTKRPVIAPDLVPEQGPQPKVAVDKEEHDFGAVEREATVRHEFLLTNQGNFVLELKKGGTSCMKCTIADLPKSQIQPGETVAVAVDYHAAIPNGPFRQTATILTNDRSRRRVELIVFGRVTSSYRAMPEDLALSTFSAGEPKTGEVRILSNITDNFAILSHEMSNAETADHFAVDVTPLAPEDLGDPDAKSGCLIKITVQPGLPLGPLRQKIRLATNLPHGDTIELPLRGTVASDISIVGGSDWNAERAVLALGDVKSSEGASRNLSIWARGPHRLETKFSVSQSSDPGLRVTLGEPQDINGVAVRVPLKIEVPRGAASVNHLGSQLGKLARVTIETTHPEAKTLPVYVQYAVEP